MSRVRFSLATLLLVVLSVSALLGGIIERSRNEDLYKKQREMTNAQLFDMTWQIRSYMDKTGSEFYPSSLDELASRKVVDSPQRYFTNPRFAELDVGFVTIAGIKRQDSGCIWLYENIPANCQNEGRWILEIEGEALVPVLVEETSFQEQLSKTLKRPSTKAISNDRKAGSGWPIPNTRVEKQFIAYGKSPETFCYFNVRRGHTPISIILYIVAAFCFIAAVTLFVHQRRQG